MTDSNGCSTSCVVEVGGSTALICTTTSEPSGCSSPDGSATAVVDGGTFPYSYQWSNGGTGSTIFGLISGTYLLTVTDAVGCTSISQAVVGSTGNSPVCSVSISDATCGDMNGVAIVEITSGGTAPFTYVWSTGEITSQIENLAAGPYEVTVTDALGCQSICATTISSIGGPVCELFVTDAECGANNGSILALATGGTGLYSYAWSTGATTPTVGNLAPNEMYSVTVTDSKGCSVVCTAMVLSSGMTCGEIGDRVWHDLNGDGRQGANESGIPNVTVNLFNATTGEFVTSVVTNAVGEYCFTGLPMSDYYVEYTDLPLTFIPTQQINNNGIDSKVSNAFGPNTTDVVSLTSGQRNKDIDGGFYAGGAIGNTVWLDNTTTDPELDSLLTLNRLDSGDERMEGVVVKLYEVAFASETLVACDTTGASGEYLFTDLPLGTYVVEFIVETDTLSFVSPNATGDDTDDSDVETLVLVDRLNSILIGRTGPIQLGAEEFNPRVDAGLTNRVTLDIELLEFKGDWNADRSVSELFWSTATEVNSDIIAIERADDLRFDFEEIGALRAAGNSSVTTFYEFDDETITVEGIYYYRLRMVDLDGTFMYSQPISINATFEDGKQNVEFAAYPNPVIETLNLEISVERPSEVSGGIYDVVGQLIAPIDITEINRGKTVLPVEVSEIPVGTYLLRIRVDDQVLIQKISIID